jgi:PAS domain S-box-containing protein
MEPETGHVLEMRRGEFPMTDRTDLLEVLPVAIYMTDAEGRITFYNQAAADLWGCCPQLGTAEWCGSWRLYWPDGRPMPHDQCPMAVALKEGRPVRGAEAIAERPDGSKVPFMPYPTPLKDASGRVSGAINLLVDISERKDWELELEKLAAIVTSSDDAIISKTIQGRITSWNAAATRLFGYEADEVIGQPITIIIPPELHAEEKEIIARLRKGEHIDHYETVRLAKDGRRIDISLSISPLRERYGSVVGAAKVARDITERKRTEKLQRLLLEELNHRVKNTLAIIQAIVNQSLRHARSPKEFVYSFTGRLQALAQAHDLLTRTKMQGAEVMQLVREQVLLGDGAEDQRVSCSGPAVVLDPQAAIHLALVLHELATNARKYGALSLPKGRLSVSWEVRTNGDRELVLHWTESGAARVSVPRRRGFGTTLIERMLKVGGGKASTRYGSEGIAVKITMPIPNAPYEIGILDDAQRRQPRAPLWSVARERLRRSSRMIIIEDDGLLVMDMESILSEAGCKVVGVAGTLDDARKLIAGTDCDAAMLDANLLGKPVDALAAMLAKKDIPFAFVTGHGRDSLPEAFRAAIVLNKPFSQADLIGTFDKLMDRAPGVARLRRAPARAPSG